MEAPFSSCVVPPCRTPHFMAQFGCPSEKEESSSWEPVVYPGEVPCCAHRICSLNLMRPTLNDRQGFTPGLFSFVFAALLV